MPFGKLMLPFAFGKKTEVVFWETFAAQKLARCCAQRGAVAFDHLPIIALSAQDDPDSLGLCVEAGMNGHVAKPLDADRLWDVLIKSIVADAGGGFVSSAAVGRRMPASPSQSSEPCTAAVLFDPQPLGRLRSKVAPDRFDVMLRLLLEDCRVQVARLRQCAFGGDFSHSLGCYFV